MEIATHLATMWVMRTKKPGLLRVSRVLRALGEAWPFTLPTSLELFVSDPFVWPLVWPLVLAAPDLVTAMLQSVRHGSTAYPGKMDR